MKMLELASVILDIKNIVSETPDVIKRVGIFGSLAKNSFTDQSDIDIVVEYATTLDFDYNRYTLFCKACNNIMDSISENYGRNVDILHVQQEHPDSLIHEIQDEVVWV